MLDAFVTAVNLCEPKHKYLKNPYPTTPDQVRYSHCKSTSQYIARCGPIKSGAHIIKYGVDKTYFTDKHPAEYLAVATHELTHITHGTEYNKSNHPHEFWTAMADHANTIKHNLNKFNHPFNAISKQEYTQAVINEPNEITIDKRIHTVEDCQNILKSKLKT